MPQQRGRKSAASLIAQARLSGVEVVRRPEPPPELNDEQAEEWRAVVGRLPADWFGRETFALLVQHCRHVSRARKLSQWIEEVERSATPDPVEYTKLLHEEAAQTNAIQALATRMRISQAASYDAKRLKPTKPSVMPWDGVIDQKAA